MGHILAMLPSRGRGNKTWTDCDSVISLALTYRFSLKETNNVGGTSTVRTAEKAVDQRAFVSRSAL
jgi:hypothetical protein